MSDCVWVGANVFGKRAEVFNAIHAMAVVSVDDSGKPIFVGAGNLGFAPFGVGPNFSEKIEDGVFRLHLLTPISINFPNQVVGKGEGLVFSAPLGQIAASQAVPGVNTLRARTDVDMIGVSDVLVTVRIGAESPVAGVQAFERLDDDISVIGNSFVDLIVAEIDMVPDANPTLDILASASVECELEGASVDFRVILDGNPVGSGASYTAEVQDGDATFGGRGTISILERADGVEPGTHTVVLQWRTSSLDGRAAIHLADGTEGASLKVTQLSKLETERKSTVTFQVIVFRFPPKPGAR
jgi:hypothetical protein